MTIVPAVAGLGTGNKPSRISTKVDLDGEGKQFGYLNVPYSRNDSAWGSVQIPIIVIANGSGPTLLFTAAAHGDEYEGPIALMDLARSISADQMQGRIVLLPAVNLPAVTSATRLSPIDGLNMNRIYPGRRDGTVSEMIADYVYSQLVARSDVVVDLHSGGKTLNFVPSAVMHYLADEALMEQTLAAVKAFGAPMGLVLRELDSQGMLDTAVEDMGRVFISTELGGAGTVTRHSAAVAKIGVRNLMAHFGLLDEDPVPPGTSGWPATRMMHTPEADSYVISEHAGIYEPLIDLGDAVAEGQPVGQIHSYEDPHLRPRLYRAFRSGVVYCRHVPGLTQKGDCLAVIATDYETAAPVPDDAPLSG